MGQLGVGIIGCGMISEIYLKNLTERFSGLKVECCSDADSSKAADVATKYGIQDMSTSDLLSNPDVDVVLNLTPPKYHHEVSFNAIHHNKHIYSEKPLAISLDDAKQLIDEALAKNLRIGCAPDTVLGPGIQTSLKAIKDGWIGDPLTAFASVSSRGHERWHANPGFYYKAGGGPHLDMGPYYISTLVAALGPVRRVNSMSRRPFKKRIVGSGPLKGEQVPVEVDTHFSANLEMKSGVVVTVIMSFDIWSANLPHIEIYGTSGSIMVPDPNTFDGPVKICSQYDSEFIQVPQMSPFSGNLRGLGLAQMCHAIQNKKPHFASGEMALHVLEVLLAIEKSAQTGQSVNCSSDESYPITMPEMTPGLQEIEYGF